MPSPDVLACIGHTPLAQLKRLVTPDMADVYLKLEAFNPTHSYKDRLALALVEAAEGRGQLKRGMTVLECTGGSTGPALALVCAVKGYPFRVISSDAYAAEKLAHMQALGAELILESSLDGKITPDLWPRMLERARDYVAQGGFYWTDQFSNRDALPGYARMGEEILAQVARPVDAFCAAVGTAGMLMGVGQVLLKANPKTRIVALEPESSAVLSGGPPGPHNIDGTAAGFIPPLFDRIVAAEVMALPESQAREMARDLARREGIMAGTSTGLNLTAALQLARQLGPGKAVVTVACDSGLKYLHSQLY